MTKIKLKKGDLVRVISGSAKGRSGKHVEGKIISIDTKTLRVVVEGINMISKSEKPNAKNTNGGIVKKEGSIHISNLMAVAGGKTVRSGKKSTTEKAPKASSKKSKEAVK